MLVMVESAAAPVRFSAGNFSSSNSTSNSPSRRLSSSARFFIPRRFGKPKSGIRASAKGQANSGTGPVKPNAKPQRYHPFEDIAESELVDNAEEATLTPAETTRTIVEVNSKATMMFSGMVSDHVHDNVFWPDLPYVTDEYGNIYFQVNNEEDILKALATEENIVQVIIGLDAAEMISEMQSLGQAEIDFGIDNFDEEDSDFGDDVEDDEDEDENDDEEDWVAILDDEGDADDDYDEALGDWAKLDTMRASHPMYFAKTLAEAVADDPIDFMDQPPAGLVLQGFLRPAFLEEHVVIQKHISQHQSGNADKNEVDKTKYDKQDDITHINGRRHENGSGQDSPNWADDLEKDGTVGNGTSFYKLEMLKIQLISAHGNETYLEVEDFRRARPDAIAHSAARIISRFKAGGEKTMQALRSLCWRSKGIQVEEISLIGVDSLGFDLRVCSGTQVQTLRFAFKKQASSEYSAERQLNDLLFPRIHHKSQQKKEAHQTEL